MNKPAQRTVLFDLDGTLLNTAPDLVGAVNDLRIEDGLDPVPFTEIAKYCSYGGRGMLGRGFDITPEDDGYMQLYDRFITRYRERMTQETHPYKGIRELIPRLVDADMGWGIVTNKAEALARPIVEHIRFLPTPGCLIGGDTAKAPKPDPAPLLLACERMGTSPRHGIYVGDSDRDIIAGHAAGMKTIAAAYGYIPDENPVATWKADAIAQAPRDLWAVIQRLFAG